MSAAQSPPPVPEKRSRWRRWWLGVLLLPVLLVAALAYGLLATEAGLRQALQWAESLSDGMVQVSAPAGTLGSEFTLATLRVRAPGVDIDADGLSEDETFVAARAALKRAYTDFVESTPLKEKVFKVLRDQDPRFNGSFIGLDALTLSAK